ncbi:MAG: DNA polymerase [Patescibacteria group bacterium]|nr:DNA polymerase [Patescibacteria group bacterium]
MATLEDIKYEFITTQEALEKIVPGLEKAPTVSVDTEGNSLDPYQSKLLLLQLSTPEENYVIDCTKVNLSPVKAVLEAEKPLKILQNAKYDYSVLKVQAGIILGAIYDTMIAERLITCGLSREISLRTIADKYLGVKLEKVTRESFTDPKNPALRGKFTKEQLDYAARDSHILLDIFKKQFKQLQEQGLIETAKLEFKVISVVAEMELKGSLIDTKKWRAHIEELEEKRNAINQEIQNDLRPLAAFTQVDLFGNEMDAINLDSPLQLLDAFKKLGVELPNTSEATLQKCEHPLAKKLLEYRGYEKMITSFGETILQKINPITGRLHPDFIQLGADTGRFACNNPNLQQIPAESGFRSCFVASPGYKLVTADYSQIELRIMAEVSEDPVFLEAFLSDQDLHTLTASQMFRIPIEQVDKAKRFQAKSINFGLMYGRGPASLAVQIGVTVDEARELLDVYFKTYRKVKQWLDNIGRSAVKNCYVRTLGGRRRSFILPDRDHPDYLKLIGGIERQGKNTPIQGTSADITKYALIFIYGEFSKKNLDAHLIHTVHDEIVSEAREDIAEEVAKIVEEQMIRAGALLLKKCPVKVEVKVSNYWEK